MRNLIVLFVVILCSSSLAQDVVEFEIKSEEAWRYMLNLAEDIVPLIYEDSEEGYKCKLNEKQTKQTLETVAFEKEIHPARLAESVAAFFWNDWTALYIEGFDIEAVIDQDDEAVLGDLLEAFYQQHSGCLLTVMKVLIDGYEGYYTDQANGRYIRLVRKQGEPYQVLALSTDYFDGTGVFEPLGIVYGVRLAGLLKIDWIRKPAIDAVTLSVSKRIASTGNPLKIYD